MGGESEILEEGVRENLRIAEGEYDAAMNRLFGLRPEGPVPYEEVSKALVSDVVRARLEMLRAAERQMDSGKNLDSRVQEPLADCERALEAIEGKRKSPRGLKRTMSALIGEAKEESERRYSLDMADRPPLWKVWRSYDRQKIEYQAETRRKALAGRRRGVVTFVNEHVDQWMAGKEPPPPTVFEE